MSPVAPSLVVRRRPTLRQWLGLLGCAMAGMLPAADFSLLSTSVSSMPAAGTATVPGRFSLHQTTATPVPAGPATSAGRFALSATSGTAVAVQQPGLPELRFRAGPQGLELTWDDAGVSAGLLLERSPGVTGTWEAVPVSLTPAGRSYVLTGGTTGSGPRFFRLRKP